MEGGARGTDSSWARTARGGRSTAAAGRQTREAGQGGVTLWTERLQSGEREGGASGDARGRRGRKGPAVGLKACG
jgi:hypothetical protein